MRLSVNSNDPGYPAWRAMHKRGASPVVTVDGVEARHCHTVDTKRGIAVAADLDSDGMVQLNSKRDAVKLKVMKGCIDIRFEAK